MIRTGSGNTPIVKKCGSALSEQYCAAGVIPTAEFPLENMSDLTRCLIVPITEKMQLPDALCPELIRHFSAWFTTHGDEEIFFKEAAK